jgi:hypothetical protein
MLKRVVHLSVTSLLFSLPVLSCTTGEDDAGLSFGSFSTTQSTSFSTTVEGEGEEDSETGGDGDGDTGPGDGDGDTGPGDGDGDTGDGDGDGEPGDGDGDDTSCPPGEFGCPCDNGECAAGLQCNMGECTLGGGDGDGDGDGDPTTGGGPDPWDPEMCPMPSIPVTITGIAGSVCSAPCAVDLDCPAGPNGTDPACVLVLDGMVDPDHCALICDPLNDTCSVGATCKEVEPGLGICTYP